MTFPLLKSKKKKENIIHSHKNWQNILNYLHINVSFPVIMNSIGNILCVFIKASSSEQIKYRNIESWSTEKSICNAKQNYIMSNT